MAKTLPAKRPFLGCKVYGPYKSGKRRRRRSVVVLFPDGSRTTMDYARFRMRCKMGRRLGSREIVDHKDNNPSNNRLYNLQIVTPSVNRTKDAPGPGWLLLECGFCGGEFERRANQRAEVKGYMRSFCGRSCSAKYYWAQRKAEQRCDV